MRTRRCVPPSITALFIWLMTALPSPTAAATTWIVDDDGVQCPTRNTASIQAAITLASPGDTIDVCPGTYMENLILNKRLKLLGAQDGVDARGRVASESVVTPPLVLPAPRILELQTGSEDSIIDGFTFSGGTRAIESTSGPLTNLEISNNRIVGFTNAGVFLNDNGINITISKNDIDGTTKVGAGDLFHLDQDNFDGLWFKDNRVANGLTATGFFVDGTRNVDQGTTGSRKPEFTGNLIERNLTGVNLGRLAWGDGPIRGNVIRDNLSDGLQGGPKNSTIEDNWFHNNGRNGLGLTSFGNTTDPARGAQNNTIKLNCFTNNGFTTAGAGISFSALQFPGTISTNKANQNNISGNAMGARYLLPGTEAIDAENNWWRAADGPGLPDGSGSGDGVDGHGQIDFTPWLTSAVPGTPCGIGPATNLTLDPVAATNPVDTMHCVTATVTNIFGIPQSGVDVQFTVTGSVMDGDVSTTDGNGEAEFCYQGPALPGADTITATADADGDTMFEVGEPTDIATKTWILPVTTPGCEITITNGGWIIADNGDRGSFGGNAKADGDGNVTGQEEYQDHGPVEPFNLHGDPLVIVCGTGGTSATIFGDATINGTGSHTFRIDVQDNGEPGRGVDHYRIQVDTYDSGDHMLEGGNVQIRQD